MGDAISDPAPAPAPRATITTGFLIAGAGPAGASLACFLSQHGLSGVMIAAAPSTADTPRAHITNMAALECLADVGLADACLAAATAGPASMEHNRWCHSMTGPEYARVCSWGHEPTRRGDYVAASPFAHVDLPQTLLEPILVERARATGWDVRFNTALVRFDDDGERVTTEVRDVKTGETYAIRSKYLFGCDGARSQVVRQLGIPLYKGPGGGYAINILVEADLAAHMKARSGNLHWIIQPDRDGPPRPHAWMSIARMVKPWHEWMFIVFPEDPSLDAKSVSHDQWLAYIREAIGDAAIPAKILDVSTWKVNEVVAEYYSAGRRVHCLGDAVHRHPPFNGLGSNTCIQDAYNLAWKVAYVERGARASPALLDTYSPERQPVGAAVIARANQAFRDHEAVWEALGMTCPDAASRRAAFAELGEATPAGRQRRQRFQQAVDGTRPEFQAVGQEMNQRYDGPGVYVVDEPGPRPELPADPVLYYGISTYPGARLPHAWLNTRIPQPKQISTQDLAGGGVFTLLTGVGGCEAWRAAAKEMGEVLGVEVRCWSIGWGQDYEDVYFDWARRREVDEEGCVLVRPDRFVCWRSRGLVGGGREREKLMTVLVKVLGWG